MRRISHFISGVITSDTRSKIGPVFNPATGAQIAEVEMASSHTVAQAVESASTAFSSWSEVPASARARIMFRFKDLLERRADDFAKMVSLEHGKTLDDARGEIVRGMEVIEFACGIPHLMKGEFSDQVGRGIDTFSKRHAVGVCAGITPFNFPIMVPLWMLPIAIVCGNTFVLKPSEKDPSASLMLAELLMEAGLPAGVLNVVNGGREAVDDLLLHPNVAAISFVGSTIVGEHIYKTAAAHGKRVQALCGAKNHMVVMPDADLDQTVDALVGAAYGSAGERCMAISVAVAVGDVGDELIRRLSPRVRSLKIGAGCNPDTEMGPLVTQEHRAKVLSYIAKGVEEGAELVVDGRRASLCDIDTGFYVGASLFDNVAPSMCIYKDEIFGPVLAIVRVPSLGAAIELINLHEYGNGASIFTSSGDAARAFDHQVSTGMVGINVPIPVPVAFHSFGGWKRSAFGDRNVYGPEGVGFYTRLKTTTSRWSSGTRVSGLAMPTLG
ncbi:CoA-acylating methylmalonate-semialdehyde dehydrogenase [Bradyrhizobium septentrionale]|uniref:methylmalonate-semialdehyde dehydrogenase (CoA acylating) n=1 Tax=Bradyrhizobium septentrionale TaxID=1404411 RepID=A0ABZ2P621_9BRAD